MIRSLIRSTIERFPSIALFLRNCRDLLDQRDPPKITPWGFTLAGHDAMAGGNHEPQETKLVRELLEEVDILVNVGANVGYYCCHALSLGKPVIAIEPIARNLHYLLNNIRDNGWSKQAQVFPVALGADTNILPMWGSGTGASLVNGWASIPEGWVTLVPVFSLDRVLGDSLHGRRALIVVDIEGAEYMMLQGAMNTLRNDPKPIWLMEISTTEHQPTGTVMNPYLAQTFELFFAQGYLAYTADEQAQQITAIMVQQVVEGERQLGANNVLFKSQS